VYKIVLMNGGQAEYDAILKEFQDTEDNSVRAHIRSVSLAHLTLHLRLHSAQIRKYAMSTLGASRTKAMKQRTLDWAVKSGQVKMQDMFYPIGSVAGNIEGQEMAWRYFQEVSASSARDWKHCIHQLTLLTAISPCAAAVTLFQNFDLIKRTFAKASPSLMSAMVVTSIGRFCTAQRADEVQAYFEAHPLPTVERRISQSLESMRANAALLEAIGKSKLAGPGYWK
jgi:hypothetical protein